MGFGKGDGLLLFEGGVKTKLSIHKVMATLEMCRFLSYYQRITGYSHLSLPRR
jgi:hypothetical protein